MPGKKIKTKRDKQKLYFENVDKYKKDHGRAPSWGPKKKGKK